MTKRIRQKHRRNPAPVPLCLPQVTYGLTW